MVQQKRNGTVITRIKGGGEQLFYDYGESYFTKTIKNNKNYENIINYKNNKHNNKNNN